MIIDTHAHCGDDLLWDQIDEFIIASQKSGVSSIIQICTDLKTFSRGQQLVTKFPHIYLAAGIGPNDQIISDEDFFSSIEQAASEKQLIAIGEIGLDYYYDYVSKEVQKQRFTDQLDLALKYHLPVVIHCRNAFEDVFEILKSSKYSSLKGVFHCFTGSLEEALEIIKMGWKISFSGIITYKSAKDLQEVASKIPLESIVVETDAPYLAPVPFRGKLNQMAYVRNTLEFIASLKNIDLKLASEVTSRNALSIFKFKSIG